MNTINSDLAASESRKLWAPLLGLSAHEVFSLMLGVDLAPAPEPCSGEGLDVTSMVGLAGQICGILTLRCTATSANLMASKMLGVDPATAGVDTLDAVGEVCNMVAGNFKNKIAGLGDGCKLSVPTVITGADYSLHSLTDSDKIEVSLLFVGLPLVVSLEVHS
jgi:chemotaxis protein CheX